MKDKELLELRPFTPGVSNYRGFAVTAITLIRESSYQKEKLIDMLPLQVSYDQYVALVAVLKTTESSYQKEKFIKRLFASR